MQFTYLSVLLMLSSVYAVPLSRRDGYAVKETHVVPTQWKQLHRAPADHAITLRIGIKQGSFDELERHLYEVSDPEHARYGKHLSHDEVHALVAPDDKALSEVHDWLEDNLVQLDSVQYSPARDWLMVDLRVAEIESLLNTEYHVYENDEGTKLVRTPGYSLPITLHRHIDVIQPTNYFGNPKAMRKPFRMSEHQPEQIQEHTVEKATSNSALAGGNSALQAACNESAVTNLCLRTLYNTVDYVPQVPCENEVAMTAFLNETANITDFHIFLSQQRQDASLDYTYNYTTIAGGADDQNHVSQKNYGILDVEADLDSQTIGGFVYPTDMRVYSTGTKPPFKKDKSTTTDTNEPYMEWVSHILTLKNPPHTISTSYGDDEQTVPYSYAKRVCEEFAQLGARGVSLFFAAGDDGVGPNGTCVANDGSNKRQFLPEFPTSCPYVTSVGATRNIEPEIVAYDVKNGYVSGAGISNYFPRPAYQSAIVDSYLESIGDLHAGLYNTTGRAYPDIAAQGYSYVIVYAGQNVSVDGTSCATPCATSVLTLVNDALIAAGKSPLGFLNSALYKGLYKGFNDITIGSTWGCNT